MQTVPRYYCSRYYCSRGKSHAPVAMPISTSDWRRAPQQPPAPAGQVGELRSVKQYITLPSGMSLRLSGCRGTATVRAHGEEGAGEEQDAQRPIRTQAET